jgi:hypothetical protein
MRSIILLLLVAACGEADTFVLVTITRGDVPTATPIRSAQATIEIDARRDETPILSPREGSELVMPASLSFEVRSGAGRTVIGASAFGDGGMLLSSGSAELALIRGDTTEVVIELGKHSGLPSDGGVDAPVPTILLDRSSATFGTQIVGGTVTQTFAVTNSGGGASAPLAIALAGGGASHYAIVDDNCKAVALPVNGTCTFGAAFRPLAVGSFAATLEVQPYQAGAAAGLFGEAVLFSLTPSALAFSPIVAGNSSASQLVSIKNESATLSTQAITFATAGADPADFVIDGGSCTASQILGPGQSCTLSVHFAPTSAGAKTADLAVTDRRTLAIPITGTGTN